MRFFKIKPMPSPMQFLPLLAGFFFFLTMTFSVHAGTSYNLADANSFTAAWIGGSEGDKLTFTQNTPGVLPADSVQLVNVDCGAYPNDLLITGISISSDGFANNGAVYLLKNASNVNGPKSLSDISNFTVRWSGAGNSDTLGNNMKGGQAVQLVNADGDPCPNDLLMTASFASVGGRTDNGAVYLVMDIDTVYGPQNLGDLNHFDAAWFGGANQDWLGATYASSKGVTLSDLDADGVTNDLLIVSAYADSGSRQDNGAVYLIKDINSLSGLKDLANPANFTAAWMGGASGDQVGFNGSRAKDAKLLFNIDNGIVDNDFLIQVPQADALGRIDNGAVYLFKDINSAVGLMDLNEPASFSAAWVGALDNDQLGSLGLGDNGAKLVNVGDGNYANDLLFTSYYADFAGRTNAGTIHLITNIDSLTGWQDLSNPANYFALWGGASPNDVVGYTYSPINANIMRGKVNDIWNTDGDAFADELMIIAPYADIDGKTDNGALYLVQDINSLPGIHDLAFDFTARWSGGATDDLLGTTITSGDGFRLINTDHDPAANDLLILNPSADALGLVNNGALYLIQDIGGLNGTFDLSQETSFSVAWTGGATNDYLGATFHGDSGVELINANRGAYANDLLIAAVYADVTRTDNGAIYVINDIDSLNGWRSLSIAANAGIMWFGGQNNTKLGHTDDSGRGIQLIDTDGDGSKEGLLITATKGSYGGVGLRGAIYLINDLSRWSGWKDLGLAQSYDKFWYGASYYDKIGYATDSGQGVKIVNSDGGRFPNDLLISASGMSPIGGFFSDYGAVYLIKDIFSTRRTQCIESAPSTRQQCVIFPTG